MTAARASSPLVARAVREGRRALDEGEAKALLSAYGIPTPLGVVVRSAQEAARVVGSLGGRCVLKGVGSDIQHKSDAGLVELDVHDGEIARAAYHRIVDLAAGRASGVLVEEWVPHERELLVGMRRDPQFGPVLALGIGGIFTEAVADVAFALPPVDGAVVREMVESLHTARMLGRDSRSSGRGPRPAHRGRLRRRAAHGRQPVHQRDRREPAARRGDVTGRGGRARGAGGGRLRSAGNVEHRPPRTRPRGGLRAARRRGGRRLGRREQVGRVGDEEPHRRRLRGRAVPGEPEGADHLRARRVCGAGRPAGDARPRHRGAGGRARRRRRRGVRPSRCARGDRHRRGLRRGRCGRRSPPG